MVGSRRVFVLLLILGRRANHPMIFHIFSISFLPKVFGQQLFKVLCKTDGIHCSGQVNRPVVHLNMLKTAYKERKTKPLWLSFWSFLTFLHHGIEKVERHLLCKFHKKIQRKSRSNVPPKLLACIGFLYKVVHKIGPLRKFNRAPEIEFNFFIVWNIFMKLGTLVHHVHGYKTLASDLLIFASKDLVMVFQSRKNVVKSSLNFERSQL